MSSDPVLYEVTDNVATITLNRPDKLNTFNKAMFQGLNAAMARFRDDDDAHVCVICASGDVAFSAGMDLAAGGALISGGNRSQADEFELDFLEDDMGGKPVIFACFGHCVGQAVALGGWADIRIAAEDTLISLPEARIGISAITLPGLLVDLIGGSQAAYVLLYGGELNSEWGLRAGFFHEVVPRDTLLDRAYQIARAMTAQAPLALRAHKMLLHAAHRQPREAVVAMGQKLRQSTLDSSDLHEGIRAFVEKRAPQFKGR